MSTIVVRLLAIIATILGIAAGGAVKASAHAPVPISSVSAFDVARIS